MVNTLIRNISEPLLRTKFQIPNSKSKAIYNFQCGFRKQKKVNDKSMF